MNNPHEPLFPQASREGADPATWPGLPKLRLQIEWDHLCKAIELDALHMLYYLDTKTGETVLVTEESFAFLEETGTFAAAAGLTRQEIVKAREIAADLEQRYLEIESRGSRESFHDMQDFYSTVSDQALRSEMEHALKQSNPFPLFREALANHPAEQARWYGFRRRRLQEFAENWLASQGIEPTNPLPAPVEKSAPKSAAAPISEAPQAGFEDDVLRLLQRAVEEGVTEMTGFKQRLAEAFAELENRRLVRGLRTGKLEVTEAGRRRLD